MTLVALGGEGKTSLVAKWAAELAHRNWPGCEAAFAWTFYSQGSREQMAASSDLFLDHALTFFGDPELAGSPQSAFDKGRRLAQLVGQRRALLILDGLEPLQYPARPPMHGKLKDDDIAELLLGLAAQNRGLCVVTTRYSIPNLKAHHGNTAPEITLSRLSTDAGVELLQSLGVRAASGSPAEFEKLVEDVRGHALTLNLLGSYLHDAHAGDIRRRDLVKLEEADIEPPPETVSASPLDCGSLLPLSAKQPAASVLGRTTSEKEDALSRPAASRLAGPTTPTTTLVFGRLCPSSDLAQLFALPDAGSALLHVASTPVSCSQHARPVPRGQHGSPPASPSHVGAKSAAVGEDQ